MAAIDGVPYGVVGEAPDHEAEGRRAVELGLAQPKLLSHRRCDEGKGVIEGAPGDDLADTEAGNEAAARGGGCATLYRRDAVHPILGREGDARANLAGSGVADAPLGSDASMAMTATSPTACELR